MKVKFLKTIAERFRTYRKGRVYTLSPTDAQYYIKAGKAEKYEEPQQKKVVVQKVKTTKRPVK